MIAAGLAMLVLAVAAVVMAVLVPYQNEAESDHDSDNAYSQGGIHGMTRAFRRFSIARRGERAWASRSR